MAKDDNDAGTPKNPVKKLRKMIKDVPVAMLTTLAADGALRSRPMVAQGAEFDGELWFITRYHSGKSEEITEHQRVNVSYVSPKDDRFVSISGTASLVRDPAKVKDLWRGELKTWFPEGKKDPDLALLRVTIDRAEYWDGSENRMVDLPRLGGPVSAPTGRPAGPATEAGGAQG